MNARTHNELPHENTVPPWLLPCTCGTQRCHCNARLNPYILYIIGHPYNHPPPIIPHTWYHHTIHQIHVLQWHIRHWNPRQKNHKIPTTHKQHHNKGLERSPTHDTSCGCKRHNTYPMKNLETTFTLPITNIKNAFKKINIIATQYTHSILVHKQWLENQQTINDLQDLS